MSTDKQTLAVYAEKVGDYVEMTRRLRKNPALDGFINALPGGGTALDLGCGPAMAAVAMRDAGLKVTALDASPDMVALAVAQGVDAKVASFADLDMHETFDGVWASFSLLHAPKSEMPDHLRRIHRALRPGGRFTMGMKTGTGEDRDALGRFYAYYTGKELSDLLQTAGFTVTHTQTGSGKGLAGTDDPWIWITSDA